jgi:hypothetical protein
MNHHKQPDSTRTNFASRPWAIRVNLSRDPKNPRRSASRRSQKELVVNPSLVQQKKNPRAFALIGVPFDPQNPRQSASGLIRKIRVNPRPV